MQAQLEAYQSSQEPDEARYRYICEALREIALEGQQPVTPAEPAPASASTMQETETTLVVTLRNVGAREQTTLRDELTNMGEVTDVEATSDSMTVTLQTTASAEDITAVLCFVLDSKQIEIRSAEATRRYQRLLRYLKPLLKAPPHHAQPVRSRAAFAWR